MPTETSNQNSGIHCWISGHVQGVFYRKNTAIQANDRQLTGWVQNLPDGRVEVIAFGAREQLDDFLAWLHQGPPAATVTQVETESIPWESHENFGIRG